MKEFNDTKNMIKALDTSWNTIFGILIALWASLFVESWRSKQNRLIFEWDMDTPADVLGNDERIGEFRYQEAYDPDVNKKMKIRVGNFGWIRFFNTLCTLIFIAITFVVVVWFEEQTYDDVTNIDPEVLMSLYSEEFVDPLSVLYGFILKAIGSVYEWMTDYFIEKMNYRFRKDHNEARAS